MIHFHELTIRNFLSYGNVATKFVLDAYQSTFVMGKNGHGKSTWIDALTFVLFNKAYRNITKNQLVNSINKKNCVVEVTFTIGSKKYKVVRGIKPAKFEIWCDEELLDQEAATRDYQAYLENEILRLNFKTFSQILILSSEFMPFMSLPAASRREIVEDILDIGVFSTMNKLLKERIQTTKTALLKVDAAIEISKNEGIAQKKIIEILTQSKDEKIRELEVEIEEFQRQKDDLFAERISLKNETKKIQKVEKFTDDQRLMELKNSIYDLSKKIEAHGKDIANIKSLTTCPTCFQSVCDEHKILVEEDLSDSIYDLNVEKSKNELEYSDLLGKQREYQTFLELMMDAMKKDKRLGDDIQRISDAIDGLRQKQTSLYNESSRIDKEREILKNIAKKAMELFESKERLLKDKNIQEVSLTLLKDSGIKASIVKEYLPVLNSLINKELARFNFFVDFNLDENFSETIKSRGRDEFSYDSFSKGEKRVIDLAILFSFRRIAELKNSAKINVLVCDEVDGGLDPDALEDFVHLMTRGMKLNVFVISHVLSSNSLRDEFDSFIKVKKIGDFSSMTQTLEFMV